jgi:hypothetical protein
VKYATNVNGAHATALTTKSDATTLRNCCIFIAKGTFGPSVHFCVTPFRFSSILPEGSTAEQDFLRLKFVSAVHTLSLKSINAIFFLISLSSKKTE